MLAALLRDRPRRAVAIGAAATVLAVIGAVVGFVLADRGRATAGPEDPAAAAGFGGTARPVHATTGSSGASQAAAPSPGVVVTSPVPIPTRTPQPPVIEDPDASAFGSPVLLAFAATWLPVADSCAPPPPGGPVPIEIVESVSCHLTGTKIGVVFRLFDSLGTRNADLDDLGGRCQAWDPGGPDGGDHTARDLPGAAGSRSGRYIEWSSASLTAYGICWEDEASPVMGWVYRSTGPGEVWDSVRLPWGKYA